LNKKLFLTAAAIPVALIVPTVASAEEMVTVTGQNIVNETLTVHQLPNNAIVNAYQWYYLEKVASEDGSKTSTNKPIAGATSASLKVPVEAAGKTIFVEATTTEGKKYQSEQRTINQLDLAITTPTLEGFSTSDFVAPGETVKIAGVTVTDKAGAKLTSGQITYSYQWFYHLGEGENSFTIIEGASGSTYTIPKDAIDKGIKDIIVKVKAQVGASFVESPRSEVISISKEPTDTLTKDISNLLVNDNKYNVSDLKSFEEKVKALESKYQALSAPAKGNVSNYAVLKRALEDVDLINKLNEKVDKVEGVNDKDLPKYIKEIETAYDKFDLLQRSLDVNDVLYTSIKNLLNEPNDLEEIKEVRRLNQAIVNLLSYSNGIPQYVPSDKDSLQGVVNTIEADIAKLSQNYRGAVQNLTILNEAKADIKKVEQFIKSFDKLSTNNTPNKQVTVAKSIRSTYEKLTYKQLKLVPDKYVQLLTTAESAEESQIATLNNDIDSYIGDDIYPINPSASSWQSHVNNVARMVKEYKSLTKASAAKIEGYDSLVTLQKDLKTAEKVIKDMDAYQKLSGTTGVTESKLNSSYTNTLKAFNKLTTLQQSLVYNADDFLLNTPKGSVDGKVPDDKAAAEALKGDIAKYADVTKFTFDQLEKAVDASAQSYKKLSSAARKYVTNYYLLTAAQKDISGVKSFYKKIQTAKEETDAAKQAKKIESVQKAYAKLPANQQQLAKEQYDALLKNQIIDGNAPNIKQLNYDILKAAIADVKKVESFMKTYEKSFSTNPSTVIKAFEKLTSKQVSLIHSDIRKLISEKQQGQQQTNEHALTLIESINSLLVNGEYIADLEGKVKDIRTKYDALSANDKKIVKNYSKLTQAESDLKKVADVHALYKADGDEAAIKAWQSAYGKLSKKLELLYKNMYPQDIK